MADVSVLEVLLYGQPIGTLTQVPGDRSLFAFNDEYVADERRPVLGLGFKDSLGELITEFRTYGPKVMPFFSNLLPEGHLRAYLAKRAEVNPEREFFLLWALGTDLPGAITVRPADGEALPPGTETDADRDARRERNALRFSLAGIQLKFSAVNETTGGLTIPARGAGGSWIVKLPSSSFAGVPENEYSIMKLAGHVGIDVPAIDLVDVAAIDNLPTDIGNIEGQAFIIERFDRLEGGTSIHMEDFAQIFGVYPADKYAKASCANIGAVIAAESHQDIAEFIRRLVFNVLVGNSDLHLKNWSMRYPDRRHAVLAPAHDFVSTIAHLPDDRFALNFSRTRLYSEFTEDELAHLANRAAMPEAHVLNTARETVELFRQYWKSERAHLPLHKRVITAINAHMKSIPLASGMPR